MRSSCLTIYPAARWNCFIICYNLTNKLFIVWQYHFNSSQKTYLANSCHISGYPYPWGNICSVLGAGLSPLIFPILLFDLYKKIDINNYSQCLWWYSQCICVFGGYYGGFFVIVLFADLVVGFFIAADAIIQRRIFPTFYPQPLAECFWGWYKWRWANGCSFVIGYIPPKYGSIPLAAR